MSVQFVRVFPLGINFPHTDQEQTPGSTLGLGVFVWRWFLLVRVVLFRFSVSLKLLLPGEELLLLLMHLCTVTKY